MSKTKNFCTGLVLAMTGICIPVSGLACSMIDEQGAMLNAISTSKTYWIITIALVVIVIGLDAFKKKITIFSMVAVLLVAFHPAWTIPSIHDPSCTFQNVLGSQLILAIIILITAYQFWKMSRLAKR